VQYSAGPVDLSRLSIPGCLQSRYIPLHSSGGSLFSAVRELFAGFLQYRMTSLKLRTDEELYRRIRNGDQESVAVLYERHREPLYRYALHMSGNRSTAEEVTQEVFLRLIAPGGGFDDQRGSLEAYLFGIARNLLRRMRPAMSLEQAPEQMAEPDALRDLLQDETTAALYRAVQELPDAYREAVVLCDLDERSYEEAARLMDCPVGTVRSRLYRARALLGAKLRKASGRELAREQRDRLP